MAPVAQCDEDAISERPMARRRYTGFNQRVAAANAVGIEVAASWYGIHVNGNTYTGPCPVCGGTDRFTINVQKRVFGCRKCTFPNNKKGGGVIRLVQHLGGLSFAEAVDTLIGDDMNKIQRPTKPLPTQAPPERDMNKIAAWRWSLRQNIAGTAAETYLREARRIRCPLPRTLAFLPPYRGGPPSMVAAFGLVPVLENSPEVVVAPKDVTTIHQTFLRPDGSGKAHVKDLSISKDGLPLGPKIIMGSSTWPIVLAHPNDLAGHAITEGIEDGLSVLEATGLGVWVAGAANRLPGVVGHVPDWIECVTLFEHPDKSSRRAVEESAEMLIDRGIEVRVDEGTAR